MPQKQSRKISPVNIRRQIYEFLLEEQKRWHRLPTTAEIRARFRMLTEDVDLHLEQLEREGLLALSLMDGDRPTLLPAYTPVPEIKMICRRAVRTTPSGKGGHPQSSIRLDLSGFRVAPNDQLSLVEVADDSMIDAGIWRGDLAVVAQSKPVDGDIVAVEEAETLVLRRYLVVAGLPHLLAENSARPKLQPAWNLPLRGVLWTLIRAVPDRRCSWQQAAIPRFSYQSSDVSRLSLDTLEATQASRGPLAFPMRKPKRGDARSTKTSTLQPKSKSVWPKSPSDFELNESAKHHRLVENSGSYIPWTTALPSHGSIAGKTDETADSTQTLPEDWHSSHGPLTSEHPLTRLRASGVESLTTTELLTLLLTHDMAAANQTRIARLTHALLTRTFSLSGLTQSSLPEITDVPGASIEQAVRLVAAGELGRRAAGETVFRVKVDCPEVVCQLVAHQFRGQKRESLRALLLDTKYQLLRIEEISLGSLNESIAHPREIFRPALIHSAYAVILTHNHPSGDPSPSKEDLLLTKRLVNASRVVGIEFTDHIILGAIQANQPSYYSFSEHRKI